MMYKVKRFINKIIKICKYIPVLWKDEDWDYSYLLDLIEFKLSRIKNCIRRNAIIVHEDVRDITISINQVVDHIKNYQSSHEVYDLIYGAPSFPIGHIHVPTKDGCYRMISINKDTGLPLTEAEETEYNNYLKGILDFEQKEWNAVWDTIKERGQRWWD